MFLQHTQDIHIGISFPIFQEDVHDFAVGNVLFPGYFGLFCPMRQAY